MKYLFIVAFAVFIKVELFGQDNNLKKELGGEPYPAPVLYDNVSLKEAKFIDLFENKQVSNLHLYANPRNTDNYFYSGVPITGEFSNFLYGELTMQTFVKGKEPRAVFRLRGNADELYLILMPGENFNHQLILCDLQDGSLVKKEILAEYYCKGQRCVQLDSWLQDVNGDGRLDIIQKRRTVNKKGKERIKTSTLLMGKNSQFKKSNKIKINIDGYQLQELW